MRQIWLPRVRPGEARHQHRRIRPGLSAGRPQVGGRGWLVIAVRRGGACERRLPAGLGAGGSLPGWCPVAEGRMARSSWSGVTVGAGVWLVADSVEDLGYVETCGGYWGCCKIRVAVLPGSKRALGPPSGRRAMLLILPVRMSSYGALVAPMSRGITP